MQSFHDDYPIVRLDPLIAFPDLAELPDQPKQLSMRGSLDKTKGTIFLTVVGSRKYSSYGKSVCESLVKGLRDYPITIVSGLALGIDAIAHQAAIDVGLPTIAFPGSGLNWNVLYPAQHKALAEQILVSGGALLSEYKDDLKATIWSFPRRNRLEAGISRMTLIIEAEEKSGTLITARLGTEYNKIVGAVPGPVTSATSKGTNWLLKLGAVPITETADILKELNLIEHTFLDSAPAVILNADEERIIALLQQPKTKDAIIQELSLEPGAANIIFSTLEIKGVIKETFGYIERIA
jgi:DNA processing protein